MINKIKSWFDEVKSSIEVRNEVEVVFISVEDIEKFIKELEEEKV